MYGTGELVTSRLRSRWAQTVRWVESCDVLAKIAELVTSLRVSLAASTARFSDVVTCWAAAPELPPARRLSSPRPIASGRAEG